MKFSSALNETARRRRRRRRGAGHEGESLPASEKRARRVSSLYSLTEHARLVNLANESGMKPTAYQRAVALKNSPKVIKIPEINSSAWVELSRLASNLNQLVRKLGSGTGLESLSESASEIEVLLDEFRQKLIGL